MSPYILIPDCGVALSLLSASCSFAKALERMQYDKMSAGGLFLILILGVVREIVLHNVTSKSDAFSLYSTIHSTRTRSRTNQTL